LEGVVIVSLEGVVIVSFEGVSSSKQSSASLKLSLTAAYLSIQAKLLFRFFTSHHKKISFVIDRTPQAHFYCVESQERIVESKAVVA